MNELYEVLVKLGPGWTVVIVLGTVAGTMFYVVANRRYHRMMVRGHAEQIALKDDTVKMLREARDEAVAILTKAKDDAVKERDVYKDKLHEEKAHHQATLFRLTEAEARPDLGKILTQEREFHEAKMKVQKELLGMNQRMIDQLVAMDRKLDEAAKRKLDDAANSVACQKTVQMVRGLVDYLIRIKVLPGDFEP